MKRIVAAIFLTLILTTSCKVDTFHMYKDEINDLLQDQKTRTFKSGDGDVNDLDGCQVDYELGQWQKDIRRKTWSGSWTRSNASINPSGIVSEGDIYLDAIGGKMNSVQVLKNSNFYPIYIDPWHPITLTHTEGSLFSSKKITEQKQIRFFAYTDIDGGEIRYQYESQTEENKNIPEKKFSLPPNAKIAPDKFGLCVVKWTARFGYNAIAEVKSKNIFSKNYLVPTGKIIEAKE